jgi:uncharacterized protein (TIGR04168 family)
MFFMNQIGNSIKIAIIGDIHDQWEVVDGLALKALDIDLALFVGDFGNESVEIVRQIADLDLPKATIMGNHDAWFTASGWGRKQSPYDHKKENRVQQQLDLLGETHVGYAKLDFPQFGLSVVGSRPFSWGGQEWKNKRFLQELYGVNNFAESTEMIVKAAQETAYNQIIFLGHNGPFGLGDRPEDSCGRDWQPLGGDFGDPDFTEAIARVRQLGKTIPLVTFGHMHHHLRHTRKQLRQAVNISPEKTIYFNAAVVPRIIKTDFESQRNFSLVNLENGVVSQISLVWLDSKFTIISEEILYCREKSGN